MNGCLARWIKPCLPGKKMGFFAFVRNFVHFSDPRHYRIFDKKLETITGKKNVMGVKETLLEEGRTEGVQIGRKEEKKELNYLFVKNLLTQTTFSVAMIASLCNVSEAFVRKIKKELNK